MELEIFGDSILKGIIYREEDNKYKLFSGDLYEKLQSKNIMIHKSCKMGMTITGAMEIINRNLPENEDIRGKAVLLEYGGNDSAYNWKEVSENPTGEHLPVTSIDKFRESYEQIIESLKKRGATIYISTLTPIDSDKYLNFISKGLSKENILKWLGDINMLYRWHESYNDVVIEIARKHELTLIDLRKPFLLSHEFKKLICADGIHPTEIGHRLIENTILCAF